ncbi:cobalamin-dependent protein [Clostridium sp. D2Q-14]|uniref:B12-binding domain-containing radical SAM protein n=1 Tax=Anaeromonas gelatinilytica TaxID=2683194 RepID=UPI00193BF60C|nr:radical SAM protein [Anaeromonas gelatinilytica]MBS4536694.1 cobalamin-dependent protein [Anaeromonas gelatinilytica]
MKVCLINPSKVNENKNASPLSTRNKYFINPYNLSHLGLGYIASVLRKDNFESDIIECPVEDITLNEIVDKIKSNKYDVVGISSYYYNYLNTTRLISKIRRRCPNIFLFTGGFLPTLVPELVLKNQDQIDCCVIGEGEITVLELVKNLYEGKDWKTVDGIAYKEDKEVKITNKRKLIDNLDMIPFPVRPFVQDRRIASLITSRGCYGVCNYCGISEFMNKCEGKKYRRRSPLNVVDEIEYLQKKSDIEFISFSDGVFHIASKVGERWFDEFEKLILERGIKIKFLCDFRANEIVKRPDLVERFKKIGLYSVNIGIESFVQKQLEFYRKNVTVEQNIKAVKIVEKLELYYTIGILIFDPTSTIEEVLEFCNRMKDMKYYEKNYNITRPLSVGSRVVATTGTEVFEYVKNKRLYRNNDFNYDFSDSRTELCYNLVEKWADLVSPVFNLNYISYISKEHEHLGVDDDIRMLFQKLYILDREYIINICKKIIAGEAMYIYEDENFLKPWIEELNSIENELKNYELMLKKYY